MPGPLLPFIAAGGALVALGTKISASRAQKRLEAIDAEVRRVELLAVSKNSSYSAQKKLRMSEFLSEVGKAKGILDDFLRDSSISQDEMNTYHLDPEVLSKIEEFRARPKLMVDPRRTLAINDNSQQFVMMFNQGTRMSQSNPTMGHAMQNLALAAAATKYITSNLEFVTKSDEYIAGARLFIAAVENEVREFDSRFARELKEDRESSEKFYQYVSSLLHTSLPSRGAVLSVALVLRTYMHYMQSLADRYA